MRAVKELANLTKFRHHDRVHVHEFDEFDLHCFTVSYHAFFVECLDILIIPKTFLKFLEYDIIVRQTGHCVNVTDCNVAQRFKVGITCFEYSLPAHRCGSFCKVLRFHWLVLCILA